MQITERVQMIKIIAITLSLVFLDGCATIKQHLAESRAEKSAAAAEKEAAAYRADHYMEVRRYVYDENVEGVKHYYLSVQTPGKHHQAFVCIPPINATTSEQVDIAYWSTRNSGLKNGAIESIPVDGKFKFLETRKGEPFDHEALRYLKNKCLSHSIALTESAKRDKIAKALAIKDSIKITAQVKKELIKATGKRNIAIHPLPRNLLEVALLVQTGEIKKGTYIKLECKGLCRVNQYQVTQPTDYGYLLAHRSAGANRWERGKSLPILLLSKTDIFKGENIEGKVKYIQYTGLGSYISLNGNKQALKIKEIK